MHQSINHQRNRRCTSYDPVCNPTKHHIRLTIHDGKYYRYYDLEASIRSAKKPSYSYQIASSAKMIKTLNSLQREKKVVPSYIKYVSSMKHNELDSTMKILHPRRCIVHTQRVGDRIRSNTMSNLPSLESLL